MAQCVLILPLFLAMVAGVPTPAIGAPGAVSSFGPGSKIHHLAAFSMDKLKARCSVTTNSTDQCSPGGVCYSDKDCPHFGSLKICTVCAPLLANRGKFVGECQTHKYGNCAHFADHGFVRVVKATTQTVAGTNYVIDAETSAGTLHLKLFEQVWTATLEVTEASITAKPEAGLLGLSAALQLLSADERIALGKAAFDTYLEKQKKLEWAAAQQQHSLN